MKTRPLFVKSEHILSLDHFRASGLMRDMCAKTYLRSMFPGLSDQVAAAIVAYWLTMEKA